MYRYYMDGSFTPENKKYLGKDTILGIDIPAPYVRDTEDEAKLDGKLAYRFGYRNGHVVMLIFASESWEVAENEEEKYIKVWTDGEPILYYTYDEFCRLGGLIYTFPEGSLCGSLDIEDVKRWAEDTKDDTWNCEDFAVDATFDDLFPSMNEFSRPVYIDDEAYYIDNNEENNK